MQQLNPESQTELQRHPSILLSNHRRYSTQMHKYSCRRSTSYSGHGREKVLQEWQAFARCKCAPLTLVYLGQELLLDNVELFCDSCLPPTDVCKIYVIILGQFDLENGDGKGYVMISDIYEVRAAQQSYRF